MRLNKQVGRLDSLTFHSGHFFSSWVEILLEIPKTDFTKPQDGTFRPTVLLSSEIHLAIFQISQMSGLHDRFRGLFNIYVYTHTHTHTYTHTYIYIFFLLLSS